MLLLFLIVALSVPTMDYSEVSAGMEGFGVSVFEGIKPDTFGVEVIGKQKGVRPGQDVIIARLTGERIEETGIVSGMSGSPVYVEGKLIGAISRDMGGPFSKEPICGITPINGILNPPQTGYGDIPEGQKISLPLCFSNISDAAIEILQKNLGESAKLEFDGFRSSSSHPTGERDSIDSESLFPGAPIGVLLVTGDASLGAFGTVTHIEEDRLYAFGHSFLGLGSVQLPIATSHIFTVAPSYLSSFKMAEMGPTIGCLEIDAFTGIIAKIGEYPSMVDMTVKSGENIYNFELVNEERLLPLLTRLMLASSILTEYSRGDATFSTIININTSERKITLKDTYTGEVIEVTSAIGDDINAVLDNGFLRLDVSSIEFELIPIYGLKLAMVRDIQGYTRDDTLFLICTLIPFRDSPVRIQEKIPIRGSKKGETIIISVSNRDLMRYTVQDISDFNGFINYLERRPTRTSLVIDVLSNNRSFIPNSYVEFMGTEERPAYEKIIETDWVIVGGATCEVEVN